MQDGEPQKKTATWDQKDVLDDKDHTTPNRGLQVWDEDPGGDTAVGTASEGTAERAARITQGQERSLKERREKDPGSG